jgi:hypothetical protein
MYAVEAKPVTIEPARGSRRLTLRYENARGDADGGEFDVDEGFAQCLEDDRRLAHDLGDGLRCQFGMFGEQRPLVRIVTEHLHRDGQLAARGVGSCVEQGGDEIDQLVVV